MNITFRNVREDDYSQIISNLNHWWGGRNMSDMLPRLFFKFFNTTSIVAEFDNRIVGFLIGFYSQVDIEDGYVHFIGVDPEFRKNGIGEKLYSLFFKKISEFGSKKIYCVTSSTNLNSIAFHQKIGFEVQAGNKVSSDLVNYYSDYDGPGEHRVLFRKTLSD